MCHPLGPEAKALGSFHLGQLQWWRPTESDPQLIVPLTEWDSTDAYPMQAFVSALRGRLSHLSRGTTWARPIGLNRDKGEDLILFWSHPEWGRGGSYAFLDGKAGGIKTLGPKETSRHGSLKPLRYDPRMQRSLPWQIDGGVFTMANSMRLLVSSALAVAFVVLPGAILWWIAARRRLSLKVLMLLPVVVAIAVAAAVVKVSSSEEFQTPAERISAGLLAAAPLLALLLGGYWLAKRRWKTLLTWGGILVAMTLLLAGVSIGAHLREAPMIREEGFDWSVWYHILPGGVIATSWVVVGWTFIMGLVNRIARRFA